eukprot:g1541.t1
MESVEIRKTYIQEVTHPTGIAWSPIASLIALAFSSQGSLGRVLVFELDSLHENVVLEVPLAEEVDELEYIDFSPTSTPLTLLTATRLGNVYLWTPRQDTTAFRPLAVNTWAATKVEVDNESEVLFCKFLNPTPKIRWPPKLPSTSDGVIVTLDNRFVHQDHIVPGDSPWLRIGHFCFMTVDSTGHFQIHWKSLMEWISCEVHSLAPHLTGRLLAVDVIGGVGSSLRMAVVSADRSSEIVLLDIKGHPSASEDLRDSFEVERLSVSNCSVERPVCSLHFQPYLLGKALFALQRTPDWIAITKHSSSSSASSFSEMQRQVFKMPTLNEELLKQVSICLSVDGSNLVLCIPKTSPVIVPLGTMKNSMRIKSENSQCALAVYSPNGVNLATVDKAQDRHVLQIWTLPEASITSNVSKNDQSTCCWDSIRINWSMIKMTDPWDICQRIKENAKVLSELISYRSLLQMDRILYKHPHFQRPDYSDVLDRIKISILKNTEDPSLKVVLMDLYSRRLIGHLHSAYVGLFGSNPNTGINQFSKHQWTEADIRSFDRWLHWVGRFFQFFCECLNTWNARHSSSLDNANANHVPLVRLLIDLHFIKRLSMLLYSCQVIEENPFSCSSKTQEKATKFKQYCEYIRRLHTIVKSMSPFGSNVDTQSDEFAEAFHAATDETRETFEGPVHLHYARIHGPLTPPVLIKMRDIKAVKESKVLTDGEIEEQAFKLGLLPDHAIRGFLIANQKSLFPAKKTPTKLELPIFDCLKGRTCIDNQSLHYSSDYSCMATFQTLDEEGNGVQAQGRLDEILQKNVTTRSPFTGSMWKQVYSSYK